MSDWFREKKMEYLPRYDGVQYTHVGSVNELGSITVCAGMSRHEEDDPIRGRGVGIGFGGEGDIRGCGTITWENARQLRDRLNQLLEGVDAGVDPDGPVEVNGEFEVLTCLDGAFGARWIAGGKFYNFRFPWDKVESLRDNINWAWGARGYIPFTIRDFFDGNPDYAAASAAKKGKAACVKCGRHKDNVLSLHEAIKADANSKAGCLVCLLTDVPR